MNNKNTFFVGILLTVLQAICFAKYAYSQTDESVQEGQKVLTQSSPKATTSDTDSKKSDQKQVEDVLKQSSNRPEKKPTKRVFKPSEEISEDRPVPFPSDI